MYENRLCTYHHQTAVCSPVLHPFGDITCGFRQTAVYGHNFCRAAAVAFNLILRNIVRVAVVDKVCDFLIFIGKLVVVGVICKYRLTLTSKASVL